MAVSQSKFEKAMRAALFGPEVKELRLDEHEFNVKRVRVARASGGVLIDGQSGRHISHHLSFRPDDQVFYRAFVTDFGTVQDIQVNVKTSGQTLKEWANVAKKVWDFLQLAKEARDNGKGDMVIKTVPKPALGTDAFLDGSWRGEANFMIANTIVLAASRELPGVHVRPPAFF